MIIKLSFILFFGCALQCHGQTVGAPWVATDALGRRLPDYAEVGDIRPDKRVGMFYYVWVGNHTPQVYNISEILKQDPAHRRWGGVSEFHFWGEPEVGYYHASDPWVIRRDMQMLAHAGVDFIFFDVTNALTYPETVQQVCAVIRQMRTEGIAAPDICFLTNSKSGRTMNKVYDELYSRKLYSDLWFRWQGKPLLMGDVNDAELRPEVRDFFTIKRSWVGNGKPQRDYWSWLCFSPQGYGYSESPNKPEQVSVTTAFHPENPHGKSYHAGQQPSVDEAYLTEFTEQGLYFQEQWSHARKLDPQIVMVTQWNEWIAQRFIWDESKASRKQGYGGRPMRVGDSYFVDVFSGEFNRDISPMKGGYTDNYYYQLVSNIRKYKGMAKPPARSKPVPIEIDGQFGDWNNVTPVYVDPPGDTLHRNFRGTDPKTIYVNNTGRNDITESRCTTFAGNLFFYVKTRDPITSWQDANWMFLLIDADQNKSTGWEGYDLLVNRAPKSTRKTTLDAWAGGQWRHAAEIEMAYAGDQLELCIPLEAVPQIVLESGFDFKWADNPQHLNDISAFFIDGDAAPDRRFNYRVEGIGGLAE